METLKRVVTVAWFLGTVMMVLLTIAGAFNPEISKGTFALCVLSAVVGICTTIALLYEEK